MSLIRTCLLGVCTGAALAWSTIASADAPTKLECVQANESAQALRQNGKFRDARAQFLVCESSACPEAVRQDCVEQLALVDGAMPTVIFAAHDATGKELRAVRVSVDGALLAQALDGSALAIDPGEHVLRFESDGMRAAEKTMVLRAQETDRHEAVVLYAVEEATPAGDPGQRQRTIGLVVGGAGVVGLLAGTFFGLKSKSTYDDALTHCPAGPSSCDQQGAQAGADAHSQATASTIAFVVGGAALAAGAVLYFTAPGGGRVAVSPMAGASTAGVRIGGAW